MTEDHCLDRVRAIVTEIAGPAGTPSNVTPDTPLGADGFWLDSIAMLDVILACERDFNVVFDWESELSPDILTTIRSLATAVRSKAE